MVNFVNFVAQAAYTAGVQALNKPNTFVILQGGDVENVDVRKSCYPGLREWMFRTFQAEEHGQITESERVELFTLIREKAVVGAYAYREKMAAKAKVARPILKPRVEYVEVVECDETGRPVTEVQAEQIAELQKDLSRELERVTTLSNIVKKQGNKIERLQDENFNLKSRQQAAAKAYNTALQSASV